ncbi:hypothetical protein [Brevundimonas sp.]|uniref:hypothetical protein n=1 Tax=Brevundimonas sp. TaxID=1871086 RepID=UPI00356938A3
MVDHPVPGTIGGEARNALRRSRPRDRGECCASDKLASGENAHQNLAVSRVYRYRPLIPTGDRMSYGKLPKKIDVCVGQVRIVVKGV